MALAPSAYDATMLAAFLVEPRDLQRLEQRLSAIEPGCWEAELLAGALAAPEARRGRIAEQVLDVDWAFERWARVPRVCASVSTGVGFLCAALLLIGSLGQAVERAEAPLEAEDGQALPLLDPALEALALGVVGTAFAATVHLRARALVRQRRAELDRLVDRVRELSIS